MAFLAYYGLVGQLTCFAIVASVSICGTTTPMAGMIPEREQRDEALALLRRLRRQDALVGVRNSGIAFDVGMMLYEHQVGDGQPVSVDMLSAALGYSGPTVRLVLRRFIEAGSVELAKRVGKTQLYCLTSSGFAGFNGYVQTILAFRDSGGALDGESAIKLVDGAGLPPDPPASRVPLRARYADGQPGKEDQV